MAKNEPHAATGVALWRGINVGKAKRIAMADLRALLEELGYVDVRTVLNSGNAVIGGVGGDCADAADRIRRAVADRLGVDAAVQVVDGAGFQEALDANPRVELAEGDPSRFLLHFLQADPDDGLRDLVAQDWGDESVALVGRVIYVHCPDGVLASAAAKALGKHLGDAVTARNWKTAKRIDALLR